MVRKQGKKPHTSNGVRLFDEKTTVTYRKVHDHGGKLAEYRQKIEAAKDEGKPVLWQVSVALEAGFSETPTP